MCVPMDFALPHLLHTAGLSLAFGLTFSSSWEQLSQCKRLACTASSHMHPPVPERCSCGHGHGHFSAEIFADAELRGLISRLISSNRRMPQMK